MKLRNILRLTFKVMLLTPVLVACKKTEINPQPEVTITGISPDTGPAGTSVTITGSGFSENASDNKITFNGKDAIVKSASGTQLVTEVPVGAGSGVVAVKVGDKNVSGPNFKYVTIKVNTLAGSEETGFVNGNGPDARFNIPNGMCTDKDGNVYVADAGNHCIRKISPGGDVSTFAGSGVAGYADGVGTAAKFNGPNGLCIDLQGNIVVADRLNNRIRKITPAGVVTTFAGGVAGYADGNGTAAKFSGTNEVCSDLSGNIFVVDRNNQCVRKITPAGDVATLAGSGDGQIGYADGIGAAAKFNNLNALTTDPHGNVYVADVVNQRIRKITPAGEVSTFAGTGDIGFADGRGDSAKFSFPLGITSDVAGNIYVSDRFNHRIRKITPPGIVSTVVGNLRGIVDGEGSEAKLNFPLKITCDSNGNLYFTDQEDNRIRKVTIQ
jgi:sugar lactone lactonase YvrE